MLDEKIVGSQLNECLDYMIKASVIFEDTELVYKYKKKEESMNRYRLVNSYTCASIDNELLSDTVDYIYNNYGIIILQNIAVMCIILKTGRWNLMISESQIKKAILLGAVPKIFGAVKYYKWLKYLQCKGNIDSIVLQALEELETYFDGEWVNSDMAFIEQFINTYPLSKIKKSVLTTEEYDAFVLEIQNLFCDYDSDAIDSISDKIIDFDSTTRQEYDNMSLKEAFVYDFANNLRLLKAEQVLSATSNYQYLMNHRYSQAGLSRRCRI